MYSEKEWKDLLEEVKKNDSAQIGMMYEYGQASWTKGQGNHMSLSVIKDLLRWRSVLQILSKTSYLASAPDHALLCPDLVFLCP